MVRWSEGTEQCDSCLRRNDGKAGVVQLVYMVIGFVLALLIGFIVMSMFGAALLGH